MARAALPRRPRRQPAPARTAARGARSAVPQGDPADELRAVEDECIAEVGAPAGGGRPPGHHRRRVPPHLLPRRLPRAARRRRASVEGGFTASFRRDDGSEVGFKPPTMRVDRPAPPRAAHPARGLRLPEAPRPRARPRSASRRRRCCTSAADARRSAPRSTPTSRTSTPTSPPPIAPRSPTSPRAAAATCSSTTPTSPICATTRSASATRARGDDPDELPRLYAG